LHQNGLTYKEIATKNIAPETTIYQIIKNFKKKGSTAVKKASRHPSVSSKRQDYLRVGYEIVSPLVEILLNIGRRV